MNPTKPLLKRGPGEYVPSWLMTPKSIPDMRQGQNVLKGRYAYGLTAKYRNAMPAGSAKVEK